MPLITTDVIRGLDEARLNSLLEAIHATAVETLGLPDTDHYQFLTGDLGGDALQEQVAEVLP